MRRQVHFVRIMNDDLFSKPLTEEVTDRRGKKRTIKYYTGVNKGKVYPYASKRQLNPWASRRTGRERLAIISHVYMPDNATMGDCQVCGHTRDKPWHNFGMKP